MNNQLFSKEQAFFKALAARAIGLGIGVTSKPGKLRLRGVPIGDRDGVFLGTVEVSTSAIVVRIFSDDFPVSADESLQNFVKLAGLINIATEHDGCLVRLPLDAELLQDIDFVWEYLMLVLELISSIRAHAWGLALDRLHATQEIPGADHCCDDF